MRKDQDDLGDMAVILGLCLVDFHHTRGPEVEYWCGLPNGTDSSKIWPNLPFQALPDGSHSFKESFTYFTLLFNEKEKCGPPDGATGLPENELNDYTTLFAVSCSRQIKSDELLHKDKDITRSTVQKAIVVISRQPIFGQIKDKLSLVTNAFFLQRNFSDRSIIVSLYENLTSMFDSLPDPSQDSLFYVGLSLRRILYDFKKDTLVLLKAILLEKQLVFYGSNVEALCNLQFGLISLIPNLLSNLRNCGSPQLYDSRDLLKTADSFKSSDRQSILRFLGFPLKTFEKGGLFSPYTPLQQMDDLKSANTSFFVIGSSNSLLVEQKSEICHVFINVDDSSVEVIEKGLQQALQLTNHDKKWIEYLSSTVSDSWNENDLFTPKNSQFEGSEDFLRWQFEDYLTGLLSSAKLCEYLDNHRSNPMALRSIPEDIMHLTPIHFFNLTWYSKWKESQNFQIFNDSTDDRLFDIFPPKHAYNGVDTFSAFQQKIAATFQNLKKNNSNGTTEKKEKNDRASEDIKHANECKGSTTEEPRSASEKEQNKWSSWKDYFNGKNSRKSTVPGTTIKATQHLNGSTSTSEAIGSALIGLGLHFDHDDETSKEDEMTEKSQSDEEKDTVHLPVDNEKNDASKYPGDHLKKKPQSEDDSRNRIGRVASEENASEDISKMSGDSNESNEITGSRVPKDNDLTSNDGDTGKKVLASKMDTN